MIKIAAHTSEYRELEGQHASDMKRRHPSAYVDCPEPPTVGVSEQFLQLVTDEDALKFELPDGRTLYVEIS